MQMLWCKGCAVGLDDCCRSLQSEPFWCNGHWRGSPTVMQRFSSTLSKWNAVLFPPHYSKTLFLSNSSILSLRRVSHAVCTLTRTLGIGDCAWNHFLLYSFLYNFACSFQQLFHVGIKEGWVKELNAFYSSQHVKHMIKKKRAYLRSQIAEENSIYPQPTKGLDFDWLNLNP